MHSVHCLVWRPWLFPNPKPRFLVPDFVATTSTTPLLHRSFVSSEKQVMCPNFFSQSVAINPDTKNLAKVNLKNLKPISLWDFPYLKPRFRAPDLSLVATTYTIPPPFFCLFGKASHVSQLLLTECCNQSWHQVFFTRRWRTQSSSQTSIWPSS